MIIDKLNGSKVRFEITVTKEQFEHGLDHAFAEINEKVEIKGFRKGHAPRNIYEAKYGVESLYEEAINHVIQDTYYDAVMENHIDVVAQPKINFDIKNVKRGVDFTYEVVVAVKPEIVLGQYKGLEVKKGSDVADEAEINAEIDAELAKNAEMVLKETGALALQETAVFDFSGTVDGVKFEGGTSENYELVIGSNQFIPGFEEQMIGMNPGESKDVVVTFPADYHEKNLAGKEAVFAVKLHEIKQRVVPTLTDDFVKDLNLEGVSSVDEYRAHVRSTIETRKKEQNANRLSNEAVEQAVANATFEVPVEMVQEEVSRLRENTQRQIKQYGLDFATYLKYMGKTEEEYGKDLETEALRNLRTQLVIEAVAKAENFQATDAEIEAKYLEIVEQYKAQKVTIEQAKAAIPTQTIVEEIAFRKAVDFIGANAVLVE
ncbi:MAG TPA: trigger factor [Bacillota bacterium]|nr:trigger factor [Bacillota bacterium]